MRAHKYHYLAALIFATALTACGGSGSGSGSSQSIPPVVVAPASPTPTPIATMAPPNPQIAAQAGIYVAGGSVTDNYLRVFDSMGSTSPRNSVDLGTWHPWQLAFDQYGYLYVAGEDYAEQSHSDAVATATIRVYSPGLTSLVRTINTGLHTADGVAVDKYGTVYVSAGYDPKDPAEILEYPAGSSTPKAMKTGLRAPYDLALDKAGNLYIADPGADAVQELPAGASAPFILRLHNVLGPASAAVTPTGGLTISDGVGLSTFSASDVANSTKTMVNPTSQIQVLPPASQPTAIETAPWGVSYGSDGTLYVAIDLTVDSTMCGLLSCLGTGFIAAYPPGSITPTTIDNQFGAMSVVAWPTL